VAPPFSQADPAAIAWLDVLAKYAEELGLGSFFLSAIESVLQQDAGVTGITGTA
jgi:hypothetical protein